MKRCFYDDRIPVSLSRKDEEILGVLSKDKAFDLTLEQRDAWHEGNLTDETRKPEFYDGTYEYLKGLGIKEI
ncbi:MAG: hypothetical protein IK008_00465 [Bacteroidales bacterium]|nr:hypothetical protein [Bacteroidales bacterium]